MLPHQIAQAIETGIRSASNGFFLHSMRKAVWRVHFLLTQRLKELQIVCSSPEEIREKYCIFRDRTIREHLQEILMHAAVHGAMQAPVLILSLEEFEHYHNPEYSQYFYMQLENMPKVVRDFAEEFSKKGMYFVARVEKSGSSVHVVIETCIHELWEPRIAVPEPLIECVY